ncbi:MAG: T9SS type A sorting domain-containing protein [Bacteroidia bacterium]
MKRILLSAAACLFFNATLFSQIKILFDATKAESAANADWVIDADAHNMGWGSSGGYTCTCSSNESNAQRLPTPAQSGVTTSTPETYWQGCLSHWAIDCVNKGYQVETLPFGTALTYGVSSNPQDLSNYNIFVVDEPNVLFTSAEKTALMNFVNNGGGLVMISDHDVSDRNGDGYDSPHIWNDFITNNGVNNTGLGFKFELENFSDASSNSNVSVVTTDSITKGSYGTATQVKWSGGTCMTKYPSQNSSVKGHVWKSGKGQTDTAVCVLTARYGCGKIAAFGDSSPMDDGTGDPNDNSLYDGYTTDAAGNHRKLLMNTIIWLAQADCSTGVEQHSKNVFVNIYPNPACNNATLVFTNDTDVRSSLSIYTISGQLTDVPQQFTKSGNEENFTLNTSGLAPGIYYCKVSIANQVITRKLIIAKP